MPMNAVRAVLCCALLLVGPAAQAADKVFVLLGRGNGTFAPAGETAVGPAPVALVARDLDNDGRLDLAVNVNNSPAGVWRNTTSPAGHWLAVRMKKFARL